MLIDASPEAPAATRQSERPFPALVAFAGMKRMPLAGVDAFSDGAAFRAGDFVVVLFTYRDGKTVQQWLGEFRAVELTPAENPRPKLTQQTVYTSTGLKFDFDSRPAAVQLRMIGPCDVETRATASLREKQEWIIVQSDFLRLGLYRPVKITVRLRDAKIDLPYLIAGSAFPADRIAKDKPHVEKAGLTREDEESFAAIMPALDQFLALAKNTPGLSDLASKVIDLPPVWGWITGGKTGFYWDAKAMEQLDGDAWGLAGTTVYRVPMTYFLKNAVALKTVFVFAPSQPPLLTCAGIVELTATSPKHPEQSVNVRVLSARRAP